MCRDLIHANISAGVKVEKEAFNVRRWFTAGHCWGLMIEDKIVFAIGFRLEGEDTGNAAFIWLVPSAHFAKYRKTCYKALIAFRRWTIEVFDVNKFKTYVNPSDEKAIRLIEHLGFKSTRYVEYNGNTYLTYEVN